MGIVARDEKVKEILQEIMDCISESKEGESAVVIFIDHEQQIIGHRLPEEIAVGVRNLEVALERLRKPFYPRTDETGRILLRSEDGRGLLGAIGFCITGSVEDVEMHHRIKAGILSL